MADFFDAANFEDATDFDLEAVQSGEAFGGFDFSDGFGLDEEEKAYNAKKDAVLFVIDCDRSLFRRQKKPNPRNDLYDADHEVTSNDGVSDTTLWAQLMQGVFDVARNKIVASDNDLVGVLLCNVRHGDEDSTASRSHKMLTPLAPLTAPTLRRLGDLRHLTEEAFDLEFGFLDNEKMNWPDALRHCNQIVSQRVDRKAYSGRVFIFTGEATGPDGTSKEADAIRSVSVQSAADLRQRDVRVELFVFGLDEKQALSEFYAQLLQLSDEEAQDYEQVTRVKLENISQKVRDRDRKQRRNQRFFFDLLPVKSLLQAKHALLQRSVSEAHESTATSMSGGRSSELVSMVELNELLNDKLKSDALQISVGLYSLVKRAVKPTGVHLLRENLAVVQSTTVQTVMKPVQTTLQQAARNILGEYNNESDLLFGNTDQPAPMGEEDTPFMDEQRVVLSAADKVEYYYELCGKGHDKVPFSIKERQKLMQQCRVAGVGLQLIGFRPKSHPSIRNILSIESNNAIYPDDHLVKGSRKFFALLVEAMEDENVVALANYTYRETVGSTRVVILAPFKLNNGTTVLAVIPQPYAEEVRNPDLSYCKVELTPGEAHLTESDVLEQAKLFAKQLNSLDEIDEQVTLPPAIKRMRNEKVMTVLLENLKLHNFKPASVPNCNLQRFMARLEQQALGWTDDQSVQDKLVPPESITDQAQKCIHELLHSIDPHNEMMSAKPAPKKRARAADMDDDGGAPPTRRTNATTAASTGASGDIDLTEEGMRTRIQNNTLDKLTVPQLKEFLKNNNKPVSGAKAALIERVLETLRD